MLRILIMIGLAALTTGCASLTTPLPPAPTVEEIVQMSKDKVAPEEIIRRMREARAVYRLSASQLAEISNRGVADQVIDYMQQTLINAERYDEYLNTRDQYLWYGPPGFYGPFWGPYPYWYGPYRRW